MCVVCPGVGVGSSAGLSAVSYIGGTVAVLVVVAVLGWGAIRLRGRLVPDWSGPPAWLADATIFLGIVIGVALIFGIFGQLRRGPVLVAYVGVGVTLSVTGRRPRRQSAASVPTVPRAEVLSVAFAGALVAAQWATHIADTFGRGMTHPDTLWYHAPFAARFVESGSITGLPDRADAIQAYYPANASLLHAVGDLPFGTDLLSPLVNVGWAALALLAAWCIGRRTGLGALCMLGTVLALGLPMIAGTHPGQASNDVACAALLLAAVAILLEGGDDLAPGPSVLAGVAAGLAVGTKLTAIIPAAVLTIFVLLLARRARRPLAAIAWCGAIAAFGSYWYVRNWIEASNPLPWFSVELGPISLPTSVKEEGNSIVSHLTNTEIWDRFYLPGLSRALGPVWPVIIVLALIGAFLAFRRGRTLVEHGVGAAIVAATVAYLFTPGSGGLNFAFNVRYLAPALFLGFAFLALGFAPAPVRWRSLLGLGLVVIVVIDATAEHSERVTEWPTDSLWVGVLVGALLLLAIAVLWRLPSPARRLRFATALGALTVIVAVLVGWPLQSYFLDHRYEHAHLPFDPIADYFRGVRDSDVIVFGTVETYPMFGPDLSNRVRVGQGPKTPLHPDPCKQWPGVLEGKYRYVVLTQYGVVFRVSPPEEWFSSDPAAKRVVDRGDNIVYRIDGPLHPAECEAGSAERDARRDQHQSSATAARTTRDVSAAARNRVVP